MVPTRGNERVWTETLLGGWKETLPRWTHKALDVSREG